MIQQPWLRGIFVESLKYRQPPLSVALGQQGVETTNYRVLQNIRSYVQPGDFILDLGCGIGLSSRLVARHVEDLGVEVLAADRFNVTGASAYYNWVNHPHGDQDPGLYDRFRDPQPYRENLTYLNAGIFFDQVDSDAGKAEVVEAGLPFATGSIKVIVLGEVLHHFRPELGELFTTEVLRVLHPDGVIIVQEGEATYEYHKPPGSDLVRDIATEVGAIEWSFKVKYQLETFPNLQSLAAMSTQEIWQILSNHSKRDLVLFAEAIEEAERRLGDPDVETVKIIAHLITWVRATKMTADHAVETMSGMYVGGFRELYNGLDSEMRADLKEYVYSLPDMDDIRSYLRAAEIAAEDQTGYQILASIDFDELTMVLAGIRRHHTEKLIELMEQQGTDITLVEKLKLSSVYRELTSALELSLETSRLSKWGIIGRLNDEDTVTSTYIGLETPAIQRIIELMTQIKEVDLTTESQVILDKLIDDFTELLGVA